GMNNFGLRPPPVSPIRFRQTIATARTWSLKLDLETDLARGDLEYGVDVELADHKVQIGNPSNLDFLVQPIPGAEQDRTGGYLNWRSRAGAGHYEIGLRVDHYQDQSGTTRTGSAVPAMPGMLAMAFNNGDRDWQDTTVDLLARYWQTSNLGTWRVSLARKNRAPTYLERFGWLPIAASAGLADGNNYLGDIQLDPETAWIAEMGIDIAGGRWWLRPAVYYHQVDDYIQGVAFDTTPGVADSAVEMVSMMNGDMTPLRFGNVDARMFGLDADYGWQLDGHWRLEGVLSVVRGERRDIDDDLYRISPDRLSLALVYDRSNWSVQTEVVGVRRQSRLSATNSEQETPGFALVNVTAGWQLAEGLRLSAGIENLLDREYEQHLSGYNRVADSDVPLGSRLPGVGRNVFVRMSLHR
ncbi:MAG: TonB-dependent receptor, partial [Proteobacteria bacterium]|nr:TonB-dependent receptor [Pseudomonadota bacterium]